MKRKVTNNQQVTHEIAANMNGSSEVNEQVSPVKRTKMEDAKLKDKNEKKE